MPRIDEIETRLAAITEGEWSVLKEVDDDFTDLTLVGPKGSHGDDWIRDDLNPNAQQEADLAFIAAAPADVRWLLGRVRELEASLAARSRASGPYGS